MPSALRADFLKAAQSGKLQALRAQMARMEADDLDLGRFHENAVRDTAEI